MKPFYTSLLILGYFAILLLISILTSKKADNNTFFLGNRKSPWYLVSIGMIGSSLSGVTFVSVPGWVGSQQFTYLQMVLGFVLGYVFVANILLPLYYSLNLTSIYTYLNTRFGKLSYKSGALLFIISRTVGSAARLYLMTSVLHLAIFDKLQVPFSITVVVAVALVWVYTFRGGIKTIIWTDTLQTILMISAVVTTIIYINIEMNLSFWEMVSVIWESDLSDIIVWNDWLSSKHFLKQFFSGVFITIVMTGLDQDMMQKNLTINNLNDARKNMYWYGTAFLPINLLFLSLGALLFIYVQHMGIAPPQRADDLFPMLALGGYFPDVVGTIFILGLIAAAYSSADSTLTSVTTSFSVDIMGIERFTEGKAKKIRIIIHIGFTIITALIIMIFRALQQGSIIDIIYTLAGYTYGPLLGLFAFGLFTSIKIRDNLVIIAAIIPPVITGILDFNSVGWFGFKLGYEKLILNGIITFLILWFIRHRNGVIDQHFHK